MDAAKLPLKERQAQAMADKEAVEEERREVETRTRLRVERKAEELEMVEAFEPILSLDEFCSLPASQLTNDFLRWQLIWHRLIDGDDSLPVGLFASTKKERMKELVAGALERRNEMADVRSDVVDG